ncbi:MAG: HNH endonuclease [Deltaproteobacteria bacterium]|nr:HNH endonuclease [Deltaproteobacteria bacterium]
MNEILKLKDKELLEKFWVLVREEKEATASVVAHLAEIDRRKLYALEGYSSLFSYCVEKYHYSESAAYRRIQAARIYPKFPEISNLLREGKLNLVTLSLIEPHLDQKNGRGLIHKILGKSKREVEDILSELSFKKEKTQDVIRRLPIKRAGLEKTAQNFTSTGGSEKIGKNEEKMDVSQKEQGAFLEMPLALSDTVSSEVQEIRKVKIEFVADEKVAELIQRAKEVLRHKYPQGKLEDLVREAFELLLEKKDPERKIKRISEKEILRPFRPQNDMQNKTRYIPQAIQRDIFKRDQGQCSYTSAEGKKCGEKNFLELDHIHPWSLGGTSTSENLRLLCRTHNQYRNQSMI